MRGPMVRQTPSPLGRRTLVAGREPRRKAAYEARGGWTRAGCSHREAEILRRREVAQSADTIARPLTASRDPGNAAESQHQTSEALQPLPRLGAAIPASTPGEYHTSPGPGTADRSGPAAALKGVLEVHIQYAPCRLESKLPSGRGLPFVAWTIVLMWSSGMCVTPSESRR